jgi:hypothetical protein
VARRYEGRRRPGGRGERQGLGVEGVSQDRLDRVVAVLARCVGARAGGLQAGRAVALGQAQDALGAGEAVEGPIAEERVDEQRAGGPDRGRALATPAGRVHQELDLVGGQMSGQGPALAGVGAAMSGDERVVVEQLDGAGARPDPEPLADEPMRPGVVGALEDDVAVTVELGPLPLGQLPRRGRQRLQGGALERVEDLERDLLDGAVDAAPGGLHAPAPQMAIAVVDVAELSPGEGVALDVVDAALLDLAFMLGRAWPAGRDQEAVVLGELPVAALHLGIVEGGVDDAGPQIIEVMCPARLRGRPAGREVSAGRSSSVRPHNHHSEFSQASNASSVRQTGVRGNAAEETGGSQSRRAASLAWMVISA